MSDTTIAVIVAAIPPTILALASLLQALKNYRQVRSLRHHVDGKMDRLLDANASAARAQGKLEVLHQVQQPPPAPPAAG